MVARLLLAGVDAGTTSVKALLVTPEGEEVASGRAPMRWTPTAHGEETTGPLVAQAARAALAEALRQCTPADRVIGLGVASMAESGVLTDDDDRPLAPVIAWHDHRDEVQLEDLTSRIGAQAFSRTTGLPIWTQWSLTKHRWLLDNEPAAARATRRYNVAEWIVRSLGGDRATELSLASRTGWLDIAARQWWSDTLDWSGASASLSAQLVPAGTAMGAARTAGDLAALDGAVLTVAGHDHQAAAVGLGCHRPGDEFDSCGTAEALLRTVEPVLPPDAIESLTRQGVTVGWHAAPGRWCLLGATQGGLVLGKVMSALGVGRDGLAALDHAAREAADRPAAVTLGPGAGDVVVDAAASPGEVWRAATRAVSEQSARLSEALSRAGGRRTRLFAAGGWTHSTAFMDAKTDAMGPVLRAATDEAGCRGAALFAGIAAGTYRDLDETPAATLAD
jgi:sugar (pentulose or hexulose) kinase